MGGRIDCANGFFLKVIGLRKVRVKNKEFCHGVQSTLLSVGPLRSPDEGFVPAHILGELRTRPEEQREEPMQ